MNLYFFLIMFINQQISFDNNVALSNQLIVYIH